MKEYKYFVICIVIALLNLFDGMITYFGLLNSYIEESNPIMLYIWNLGPIYFLVVKFILSLLILVVGMWSKRNAFKKFAFINKALVVVLFIYIYIFSIHMFWLATEFVFA